MDVKGAGCKHAVEGMLGLLAVMLESIGTRLVERSWFPVALRLVQNILF